MRQSAPPPEYLDGCTLFFDSFFGVSHKDICNWHDERVWSERRFIHAVGYHLKWGEKVLRRHAGKHGPHKLAYIFAAVLVGVIALNTAGWLFWLGRPRWD